MRHVLHGHIGLVLGVLFGHIHGGFAGHILDGLVDHAQDQLTLIASPEAGCDGLIGHHPGGHGGHVGLVLGHDGHVHGGSGGHVLARLVDHTHGQLTLLDIPEAIGHGPIVVPSDLP